MRTHLDGAYVRRSAAWAGLPAEVRAQLDATPPADLPEEAAVCAAALLMDVDFAGRSGADVWMNENMPDDVWRDAHHVYQEELSPSLWTGLFSEEGGTSITELQDPHGVIYTSAYQATANGW